jgi:hypothetical protein
MALDQGLVAFRAQLVIPEQRQLFDYWLAKAAGRPMPSRKDLSPADVPRLLPHVSLIDVLAGARAFRYRLAGSRLREVFDREVTGSVIDAGSEEARNGYWLTAHERVVNSARPVNGALRGSQQSKDHLVQFWLRLPLSASGETVDMILGHDVCVPVGEVDECDLTGFASAIG